MPRKLEDVPPPPQSSTKWTVECATFHFGAALVRGFRRSYIGPADSSAC